jgi:hypothetical protein
VSSEDRQGLRLEILAAERRVFEGAIADQRRVVIQQQQELEREIKQLKKLQRKQLQEREVLAARLAGLDAFEDAVKRGDRSLNFFQYHLHFRDVFEEKGGFDLVIGNPPYVRQEQLKEIKPALKAEYDCYTGVADLYVYFYELGFNLLKAKGHLAYITPNKWFKANYGVPLRKYLAKKSQIFSITDFGELPVFDAGTFPMIYVAAKQETKKQSFVFTQVTSLASPYPDIAAIVKSQGEKLPDNAINQDDWKLTDKATASFLNKLESTKITLDEYVHGQIYRGILTGFNQAFVIDAKTRDELIAQDSNSTDLIKPLAIGDDVRKWHVRKKDKWLIFIPWHFPLHENTSITGYSQKAEQEFRSQYSAIYNYLSGFKQELSSRNKAETNIRYEWYALQRCAATYYEKFSRPKIVYPEISKSPRFTLEKNGVFTNNKVFMIPLNDLFLLGILNSLIVWQYAKSICTALGDENKGGRLMLQWVNFKKIPIPKASEEEKQAIEKLVEKCLAAKGVGVEQWEAEIDERVAHLYGLTPADLKIIQGE